jgi:lactate 2-monooxygenase
MKFFALEWQKEIYLNGFSGRIPVIPTNYMRLEQLAKTKLSPRAFAYIAGGAGHESTLQENTSAFSRYKIVPRTLNDVGVRDSNVKLFTHTLTSPFLLSPIGVLELAHSEADLAVAKASAALGIPFIFSNQASIDMETCSGLMGNNPRWFQLYWSRSNELVASFVKRAEECGCSAIVVTLDTTMLGWRTRDLDLGYLPFLEGKGIAQYISDPVFLRMLEEPADASSIKTKITLDSLRGLISMVNRYPGGGFFSKLKSRKPIKAVQKFIATYSNPSTTWEDLKFLRSLTKLPIVLKGILHADDAIKTIEHGMDGIIVSNHGGRQIDGAISSMDALPEIVNAVAGRVPVILDSGVRSGADAFKAIALGATAVCIGRPYAYGLAVDGERGVRHVMQHIMAEFELTMGLAGCATIAQITAKSVRKL